MRPRSEQTSNRIDRDLVSSILAIFSAFRRHNRQSHLAAERIVCLQAFRAAQHARDTRRQHETERAAVYATAAVLAVETGRSPSRFRHPQNWRGVR